MLTTFLFPGSLRLDLLMLAVAVALDLALPELPSPLHPVRWMGIVIGALEKLAPKTGVIPQFLAGVLTAIAVPALFALAAALAGAGLRLVGPLVYCLVGGALLKTTFTVRGLVRAGRETASLLANSDLVGARTSLMSLVSRDRSSLTVGQAAGAAVESVTENATDSFIAPWLGFALFGLAGAFAYRAINTLDSMIGYHGKYEYLGKASARLDDLVNLIPARLCALMMLLSGLVLGLDAAQGWQTMRRDHARTESPNAGWTMSAMAGLLGIRLEKVGYYTLGKGFPEPAAEDIGRAARAVEGVALLGLLTAVGLLAGRHALLGMPA